MSFKNLFKIYSIFFSIFLFIPNLFIPVFITNQNIELKETKYINQNIYGSSLMWPIPGYTRISSTFGRRTSPTSGASSYHQGIDIPAPAGSNLISPCNAIVSFIGFNGSGGYSISLKSNNLEFIYHHVSPEYIISKGDYVLARSNNWICWTQKCLWR